MLMLGLFSNKLTHKPNFYLPRYTRNQAISSFAWWEPAEPRLVYGFWGLWLLMWGRCVRCRLCLVLRHILANISAHGQHFLCPNMYPESSAALDSSGYPEVLSLGVIKNSQEYYLDWVYCSGRMCECVWLCAYVCVMYECVLCGRTWLLSPLIWRGERVSDYVCVSSIPPSFRWCVCVK